MNLSKYIKVFFITLITIFIQNSEASCLSKYSDILKNKKKRSSILGVSIPLTGGSSTYLGYLSISSASNGAIFSSISSTSSTTLLAAGAILSSTSIIGEIITLKEFKTCKKIILQSKVSLGKDLTKFTEEIKKRNRLIILPIEHISKIINEIDKEEGFCPDNDSLPMNRNKMMNLVEDRLISRYGLLDNEE